MKLIYWLLIILLLPFSILLFFAIRLARVAIRPKVNSYDFFLTEAIKQMKFDDKKTIMDLEPELFYLTSYSGEPLRCRYYDFNKDKTVIFVHGYTANLANYIKHIPMFEKMGFNVLMYDQRYHGESKGSCTTFGYYEKRDLNIVVDWALAKNPKVLGLYGKSMGAATIIQYLPLTQKIDFAIADCPYCDLKEQLSHGVKNSHPYLPTKAVIFLADWFFRLKGQFSMNHVKPIEDIKKVDIPVLFIHGDVDDFVPTYMSHKLYNAKKDKKHLVIVPGADHAVAFDVNPELFINEVKSFLQNYGFINK